MWPALGVQPSEGAQPAACSQIKGAGRRAPPGQQPWPPGQETLALMVGGRPGPSPQAWGPRRTIP